MTAFEVREGETGYRRQNNFRYAYGLVLDFDNGLLSPEEFERIFWIDAGPLGKTSFIICNSFTISPTAQPLSSYRSFLYPCPTLDIFQLVHDFSLERIRVVAGYEVSNIGLLGIDHPAWDHSVFSKNRDRLLESEIAAKFLAAILTQPQVKRLLSSQHFSVDGTLIEAWASLKSLKPRDADDGDEPPTGGGRNSEVNFRGEKRSNQTHVSLSDPDAMLYRKGPGMEAKLCFIGHALMENRHGLIVDTRLTRVSGHAERLAALEMIEPRAAKPETITLGGDKGFDAADFVMGLRDINVTPHIAQNMSRRSAIDGRTTRHPGYAVSQRIRKRIEEGFGWMKTIAGLKKTKYRGLERVGWSFTMAAAAYNLIRLPKLMGAA